MNIMGKLKIARDALQEISLGRGPYKMDPMAHAESTIEEMKKVATKALSQTEGPL